MSLAEVARGGRSRGSLEEVAWEGRPEAEDYEGDAEAEDYEGRLGGSTP